MVGVALGFDEAGFGKLEVGFFILFKSLEGLLFSLLLEDDFLMLEEFSSLEELQEILNNRAGSVSKFSVFGSVRFSIFGYGSVRFANRKLLSVFG